MDEIVEGCGRVEGARRDGSGRRGGGREGGGGVSHWLEVVRPTLFESV